MTIKNATLTLALSGAITTLGACNKTKECDFDNPDVGNPECWCDDGNFVPVGGDCFCDPDDPTDPDCDDSDTGTVTPTVDPFVPRTLSLEGTFTYDGENDVFVDNVLPDGSAFPSYIALEFMDARYEATQNNQFRCGLLLTPKEGDTISGVFADFTYKLGSGPTNERFQHLMFQLVEDNFDVLNLPDPNASGGPIPGCIDVQNDSRRGFPQVFGDIVEWTLGSTWGVGMGNMAVDIQKAFEDLPATSETRQLYDDGFIFGGTTQTVYESAEGPVDFKLPGAYAFGFEVDEDFKVILDSNDNGTFINESDVVIDATSRPKSGRYNVFPFYVFAFQ
jgi:hypothetical protein